MAQKHIRRYSLDFKEQIVEAYFASKQSLKSFAEGKDIPARTLRDWVIKDERYVTRVCITNSSEKTSFAPIKIRSPKTIISSNIVIIYPNGVKIELPSSTDIPMLSSLIKAY